VHEETNGKEVVNATLDNRGHTLWPQQHIKELPKAR
jgi:hypothetical protein